MLIGYARVSTEDQSLNLQMDASRETNAGLAAASAREKTCEFLVAHTQLRRAQPGWSINPHRC